MDQTALLHILLWCSLLAPHPAVRNPEPSMFEKPSLVTRIAVGKTLGFAFGLAGFLMLPYILPEAGQMLGWGFLLWYTTFGAIIAIFGVFDRHPVLDVPMPWWVRAPLLGAAQ